MTSRVPRGSPGRLGVPAPEKVVLPVSWMPIYLKTSFHTCEVGSSKQIGTRTAIPASYFFALLAKSKKKKKDSLRGHMSLVFVSLKNEVPGHYQPLLLALFEKMLRNSYIIA